LASRALIHILRRRQIRAQERLRVAPGVRLNLGLHGAGLSLGPRGLHVGVNRRGMYSSAGIPGTGLYAVHYFKPASQPHPEVQGDMAPVLIGVLLSVLVIAVVVVIAALVLIL
jgi:Protein of unknown function (DUF4236)